MRRITALALAALLTLVVAAPVLAQGTADSFTVNGAISVTGIPATLDYGALDPSQTSAIFPVDALVTSNQAWSMDLSGTDFSAGLTIIGKAAREALLSFGPGTGISVETSAWRTFADAGLNDPEAEASGPPGVNLLLRTELRVTPPAVSPAGIYSGSVTWTFSGV